MALVRHNAATLRSRAEARELDDLLVRQARIVFDSAVGASEVRSWRESLPALLADVHDAGLDHVEVLLEHKLPFSPKRVDAILCGVHPTTRRPSYVVVELKQWTNAVQREDGLVDVPQYGRPVLHPVDQVRGYCDYLVDFVPALGPEHSDVHGIAYLHNASASGWNLSHFEVDAHGRLFRGDQRGGLVDELRRLLDTDPTTADDARRVADDLLNAAPRPSKPLLSVAAEEVRKREQFVLVDEQKVAYTLVEHAVDLAHRQNTKTAVIVLGGPGSGKSVLALSLLGDLSRKGREVMHATGSSAFTQTLRKIVVGSRSTRSQKVFQYFNSFIGLEPNTLDVVICDEAHRIRETSVNRFTKAAARAKARPQVDELIAIARVPVFLLDEHQVVRPGEMGTEAEITAAAERAGCRVEVVRLAGQYRCGGSEFYEQWVRRLLGLDPRPPIRWSELVAADPDESYSVAALPSPAALEGWLLGRSSGTADTARLAAGYCWRWSDPVTGDDGARHLVDDVVIGGWSRPWNAKPEKAVRDAPPSHFWASDSRGFGQVGCIYTAQGFEYDWSGVVMGPDLVRRNGVWVADRTSSYDGPVKKAGDDEFPALVRNTYKVLLTRGMKGTAVFSTDPETQQFLEDMCR
ncbi:DUF2075 domain-containing protein [Pseudonocardia alni subsp. carboxydivorans]|uniref:DUF2075 domain-containing protein n=1 Tax=Pseudonocardia alni subsp. carboxydivorans TaxID=415010 RepID=A0ABU9AJI4_PSEA5